MFAECGPYENDIRRLETRLLSREAERFGLPGIDINNEDHANLEPDSTWTITTEGKYELIRQIRQEKKERREIIVFYVSIIFGLIGAITGLVAILKD